MRKTSLKRISLLCCIIWISMACLCGSFAAENQAAHQHTWETVIDRASRYENGSIKDVCTTCGETRNESTIYSQSVSLAECVFIYDGKEKRPKVIIEDTQGNKIDAENYSITYPKYCTDVGRYDVEIKFRNKYSGQFFLDYYIKDGDIAKETLEVEQACYIYTGEPVKPFVWIDGLEEGEHYTVSYENNVNLGEGTIIVKGIGKFTGSLKKTFTIDAFSYSIHGWEVVIWECSPVLTGSVEIPAKIEGYPVTEISSFAFSSCDKIKSITLPDTIKNIEHNAFSHCTSLETVHLPEGLETIGKEAFYGCDKLKKVILPSSVKTLGDAVFTGCTTLTDAQLPEGLESIPRETFSCCTSLQHVALPSSIKEISLKAFFRCENLKSVVLPEKVERIGYAAFQECSRLKSIVLPDALKTLDHSAFEQCEKLEVIELPNGLKKLESDTFYGCKNLNTVMLPDQMESIGKRAFYGCTALHQLNVPEALKAIENYAFFDCTSLDRAIFPATIAIGEEVFSLHEETTREPLNITWYEMGESYFTYNGEEKRPEILTPDFEASKDYQVSYEYNLNAGYGIVVLEGIGAYIGVNRFEFEIARAELYDVVDKVEFSPASFTYDGTAKTPDVFIPGLKENIDFVVTGYDRNIEPGYGAVCIYGLGNYTGDVVMDFPIKLNTPVIRLNADSATGRPELSWDQIYGADEFEVYRKAEGESQYRLVNVMQSSDEHTYAFCDENAMAGKKYYYKVRAVGFCEEMDSDDGEVRAKLNRRTAAKREIKILSGYSKVKSIVCNLPRPTVSIMTVKSSGKPKLTWKRSLHADSYAVYRSMTKNGKYTKIHTTKKTSFVNTSAKVGKKYYYQVKAIYSANRNADSAFSMKKSVTCDCARPIVSVKLSGKGKPRVSWKAVKGASKYEVWRATKKNGKYTKVYTTKKLSYTNTKAKKGKVYYYKVKAICKVTKYGNSSYSLIKQIKSK